MRDNSDTAATVALAALSPLGNPGNPATYQDEKCAVGAVTKGGRILPRECFQRAAAGTMMERTEISRRTRRQTAEAGATTTSDTLTFERARHCVWVSCDNR